jgi:hypothetical protein
MNGMRWFYAMAAVVGAVAPWIFFGSFVADEGVDPAAFVGSLYADGAVGGATTDLLISSVVFWVWSRRDSRTRGVPGWWLVVPATLLVGLSLALPLYLFLRAGRSAGDSPHPTPGLAFGGTTATAGLS